MLNLRFKIKRELTSAFLFLHVSILFLNNLAWSPFVECLYPYYYPYVQWTGQSQSWGMYKNPDQFDQRIVFASVLSDGHREQASVTLDSSPRMLYFFDGLFKQSRKQEAISYLRWRVNHEPKSQQPASVALQRFVRETPPPGRSWVSQAYSPQDEYIFYPKRLSQVSHKHQRFREIAP